MPFSAVGNRYYVKFRLNAESKIQLNYQHYDSLINRQNGPILMNTFPYSLSMLSETREKNRSGRLKINNHRIRMDVSVFTIMIFDKLAEKCIQKTQTNQGTNLQTFLVKLSEQIFSSLLQNKLAENFRQICRKMHSEKRKKELRPR